MAQSSLAYQLPVQEPEQQTSSRVKLKRVAGRSVSSLLNVRVLSAFFVVVTLFTFLIYNQAQLTEVSGRINQLNADLRELKSENTKMRSELEAAMSLRSIGDQARNKLGMQPIDSAQKVYIYPNQQDKVELTENTPKATLSQTIQSKVTGWITKIQEYINS